MLNISADRDKISAYFKSTVTITSDEKFSAVEVRATKVGEAYARGKGLCVLSDEAQCVDGVVTFDDAISSFTFDVTASELDTDGEYRISIYVSDSRGVWNDTCTLLTNVEDTVKDSNGRYVLVKRNGTGTDEYYKSSYSGEEIDEFIKEVLS